MADEEISQASLPAPCVNTLIIWLARNRKAKEALQVQLERMNIREQYS